MGYEWVLGISDIPPRHWKKREPVWDDEQLTATSTHTFHQVVAKLCETALQKRRGDDSDIDHHLWKLTIATFEQATQGEVDPLTRHFESDNEEDSDDDSETNYRGQILVAPREQERMYQNELDTEEYQFIPSEEKLSQALLPQGHVMHFVYDFGTTTDLFMKVLSVRPVGVRSLLEYFVATEDIERDTRDLQAVLAYQLPKEQQIDAFTPHFSKAFLGHYVPLQEQREGEYDDYSHPGAGSVTLGLSSRIRSDKDTTFCSLENSECSSDLFYASQPFVDMNEFLTVAEQAWTPHDPENDPDQLDHYRYNMVSRHVFPRDENEAYNHMLEHSKTEYAQYGPKMLFFRLSDDKSLKQVNFDFSKVFPKTNAQFQSGKFRWIKYQKGVLRVLVGRGCGHHNRDFDSKQVLRTWRCKFASLHELLCAVEASWVYKKKDLAADTVLRDFDLDLGPSKPGPKEPTLLGKEDDAVIVAKCSNKKKLVTALSVAHEEDGKTVLYSGYADGTLTKWCLTENVQLWSKQIYPDGTEDFPHYYAFSGISLRGTAGVAGLVVRSRGKKQCIYTWSDAYDGYPDMDYENRGPSKVRCWSGKDGSHLRHYACNIGLADTGEPAHPSIATVVFCRLWIEDEHEWVDSMVVGLHCLCQTIDWNADYSDFDIDQAQQVGEGNILPFYEDSNGRAMESWRGHAGIIQAMAVIPDRYLLSYSMQHGHGLPDAFILWSVEEPGVPLCRHDCWDPSRSLFNQSLTRLHSVVGISVYGTDVMIACEDGDRIAVMTVQNDDDDPHLELHGYGNIGNRCLDDENFHGSMAMSGKYAVMANEGFGAAWLFNVEGSADQEKLDRREGNKRKFDDRRCDEDDDELSKYRFSGRELAVGKIAFPLFGGNPPKRKKRQMGLGTVRMEDRSDSGSEEDNFGGRLWTVAKEDGFGEGGPITLAISGKWLVAGFSNGSIVRAPFLPDQFEGGGSDAGSNVLTSCSRLPSDEWHCPVLESDETDGEDSDEDEGEDSDEDEGRGFR